MLADRRLTREYVEALEAKTLEDWLTAVGRTDGAWAELGRMEASVSWRITAPLRTVREIQRKVARVGVKQGFRKGLERVQRKVVQRRRAL